MITMAVKWYHCVFATSSAFKTSNYFLTPLILFSHKRPVSLHALSNLEASYLHQVILPTMPKRKLQLKLSLHVKTI